MSLSLKFLLAAIISFLLATLLAFFLAKIDIYSKVNFAAMVILGFTVKLLMWVPPIILLLISAVLFLLRK